MTFSNQTQSFSLRKINQKISIEKKQSKKVKKERKKGGGQVKEFIAKLSRGLMLPVAMLPIAGLFLGIGAAIVTAAAKTVDGELVVNLALQTFGSIIKTPGSVVFDNLPILFCVAIAITFSKDSGVAALSAIIGWFVFCSLQNSFIIPIEIDKSKEIYDYKFLFYNFIGTDGRDKFNAIFVKNVGIRSLSTSVFGGIIIGYSTSMLYNKFKDIQLPQVIGFFSGVRFIPIITIFSAIAWSILFSIVWPMIGLGIFWLGGKLGQAPYGINAFCNDLISRSLNPIGLHHAFYMPLWYTAAGGTMNLNQPIVIDGVTASNYSTWFDLAKKFNVNVLDSITGDQSCWILANSIAGNTVRCGGKDVILTFDIISKAFKSTGVNVGQYMQGRYAIMDFALPAAGIAMIMAAPKGDNRKLSMSIIASAALTSFLTGITEPIEFTFLFLAPALFWGFHAVFCGISAMLMSICGAHVGMTFSGGMIDLCIYGFLPDIAGFGAKSYWVIIWGLTFMPIYYFVFYIAIKKFNIKTPGREGSTNRLVTKAEYQEAQNKKKQQAK